MNSIKSSSINTLFKSSIFFLAFIISIVTFHGEVVADARPDEYSAQSRDDVGGDDKKSFKAYDFVTHSPAIFLLTILVACFCLGFIVGCPLFYMDSYQSQVRYRKLQKMRFKEGL